MKQLKVLESDLVSEWCSKDGDPLDAHDRKLLERFIDKYYRDKSKVTVYRGTSNVSMYGVDLDDITELSQKLFMLGVKANRYALFDDWKFGINDVSDDVFAELFDRLQQICKSVLYQGMGDIRSFLDKNSEINRFFYNSSNKEVFVKKIIALKDESKRMVKDYYVALLHTFDPERQFSACYMLSTSKVYEEALRFLRGITKKDEGILIISWVPSSAQAHFLDHQDLKGRNSQIRELDLPIYESSPYPEEQEICIKAIIPPQYILGYIHTEKKIFIPNPYLIEMLRLLSPLFDEGSESAVREDADREIIESECIGHIIAEGISIDQSSFKKILRESNLKSFVSIGADGEYKESKRNPK